MPNSGSTVVRRQLGRRLRALRNQAHKSEQDVVTAKILSRTKLWRIEAGKTPVKIGDVRALCWFYEASLATTDALANMALGTTEQNWWETNDLAIPEWLSLYVGLESTATEIRIYEPELVHGIFQTPAYTRAVRAAFHPDIELTVSNRMIQVRAQRQRTLLSRTPPPLLTAIFNESVITRPVGGEATMAEQVGHIRQLATRDHIEVRILPQSVGAHAAMIGSFAIFDFDDNSDPPVIYTEFQTGAHYLERPAEVLEHRRIFDLTLEQTIPIEEYLS